MRGIAVLKAAIVGELLRKKGEIGLVRTGRGRHAGGGC